MTRNKLIQTLFYNALPRLDGSDMHLEIWVISGMVADRLNFDGAPPNAERISIALGPVTRKSLQIGTDSLTYVRKGKVIELPFSAIYCLATDAQHARKLGWMVNTNNEGVAYAFVNLVSADHNI